MDSFTIHSRLIADYRGYIESFINIRDEAIRAEVEKALAMGRMWPEPLIQFSYPWWLVLRLCCILIARYAKSINHLDLWQPHPKSEL